MEALALVGVGFRQLSMTATAVGRVKAMVRCLGAASLARYLEEMLDSPEHPACDRLEAYVGKHGISL